jgi:protein-glutamine gamma-glutamyltransferase
MREFPVLISIALIYWGYDSDNIALSVIFALVLESHRYVNFRLELKEKDFNYISMISTITAAGFIIFYVNSPKETGIFYSLLNFLPVMLFPLNFFYLYSTSEHVNAKNLFLLFRTNNYSIVSSYIRNLRPDHIYLTAVIIAMNVKGDLYSFILSFLLFLPVALKFRAKRSGIIKFISFLLALLAISLLTQTAVFRSAVMLRDFLTDIYMRRHYRESDRSIKVGNIGSDKNDFKIELRADAFGKNIYGMLLRDRSYNSYKKGRWYEREAGNFDLKDKEADLSVPGTDSLRIFIFSSSRSEQLKIPLRAFGFSGIEFAKTRLTSTGSVRMSYTQHLIDYKTYFHADSSGFTGNIFEDNDLIFDPADSIYTDPVIDSLGLSGLSAGEIYKELSEYFNKNYTYSLDYTDWPDEEKMRRFISVKQGHCELFASHTALIYRRLGFASRYTTGYLLTEFSPFEKKFIARSKDRHAWTMVFENGRWLEFDTTPPDISGFSPKPTFFTKIYDYFSYLYHEAFMLKKENNDIYRDILLYSLIPLGLFLFYRILKDARPHKPISSESKPNHYKKVEELEFIEKKLISEGFKPENETVGAWFDRIAAKVMVGSYLKVVQKIYYGKRYGNKDLSEQEKEELTESTDKIKAKK